MANPIQKAKVTRESLSRKTVDLVRGVVERYCAERGVQVMWATGPHPSDELDGTKIVDARMVSALPLFGGEKTFQAGVTLSILESEEGIHLLFKPHHPCAEESEELRYDLAHAQVYAGTMHAGMCGAPLRAALDEAFVTNRGAEDMFRHRPKSISMPLSAQPRSAFKPTREEVERRMADRHQGSVARRARQGEPQRRNFWG